MNVKNNDLLTTSKETVTNRNFGLSATYNFVNYENLKIKM